MPSNAACLTGMNLATLLAVCLVLGAVSRPVWAQEGLPPQAAAELVRAAAEKEPHDMRVAVVSVIARHPSLRAVIVREAVRLRPEWAPDIATAAVRAFPFFVQDIAAAATTGQPGERRRAIGEAIAAARPEMHIRVPVEAKVPEAPQPEPAPPPSRWSGHVELGGSRSTGNTDRTQFSGAVRVKYEKARFGLLVGSAALAGHAHGQTLEEALAAAYANSPVLRAERAALRATDEQVPQALSNWRPTVDVTGDIERSDTFANKRTFGSKDQIRTPRGVALNITQPLFRGLRTLAATREAENTVRAARARLLSTEQDVLLDAATAYMGVVRDQAVLDLNIGNENVLRRQLEAARDRFEVGEVTRTDVSQAEARLAGATAERVRAEGDLVASRAVYRNVVGEAPRKLTAPAPLSGLPADRDSAFELARDDHPDVVSALFDERAARDRVKGVGGELLPTVSLNAKASRDFETIATKSRFEEQSIGAILTVPLYQSGAVYSRLRQAKQTVGQERLEVAQARRDVMQGVTQAWEALETARAQIVSFAAQVRANEIALEGVQREAEVGARTVLDILDAEQELLGASVDLVGAQRDEVVATFRLKAAVGRLTARQLNLPVDFYDPERHYREVRGKWFGGSSTGQAEETEAGETRGGYK